MRVISCKNIKTVLHVIKNLQKLKNFIIISFFLIREITSKIILVRKFHKKLWLKLRKSVHVYEKKKQSI